MLVSKRARHSPYPMISVSDAQSIVLEHVVVKNSVVLDKLQGTYIS